MNHPKPEPWDALRTAYRPQVPDLDVAHDRPLEGPESSSPDPALRPAPVARTAGRLYPSQPATPTHSRVPRRTMTATVK